MGRRTEMRNRVTTEQDLTVLLDRLRVRGGESKTRAAGERSARTPSGLRGNRSHAEATTRTLQNGSSPYRSKLEALFARELAATAHAGVIVSWQYEPLNFRLPGQKNFYKPDFLVRDRDGLTFYEVKGRNLSDDRSLVKMKTAAGLNTWARFVLVKRIKGQWEERHVA